MSQLILASASPRRKALLNLLNFPFAIQVADVDEDLIRDRDPVINVKRRAQLKAYGLKFSAPTEAIVLAADTTVAIDGMMLNKPVDPAEAKSMLQRLRGRQHQVHTAMALLNVQSGEMVTDVDSAEVYMRPYSDTEIEAYIATGDPMDKAGAYAIQHPVFTPAAKLEGCYLTVMGLSVCRLMGLLAQFSIVVSVNKYEIQQTHQGHNCPLLTSLKKKHLFGF